MAHALLYSWTPAQTPRHGDEMFLLMFNMLACSQDGTLTEPGISDPPQAVTDTAVAQYDDDSFSQEEIEDAAAALLAGELVPFLSVGDDGATVFDIAGYRASADAHTVAVLDGTEPVATAREAVLVALVSSYELGETIPDSNAGIIGWVASKIWSKLSCGAAKSYAESNGYSCPGWAPSFPWCIAWYVATCAQSAS